MRLNTLYLNGWTFTGRTHVAARVYAGTWANTSRNLTAREIYSGPFNRLVGILVQDAQGQTVKFARNEQELILS